MDEFKKIEKKEQEKINTTLINAKRMKNNLRSRSRKIIIDFSTSRWRTK